MSPDPRMDAPFEVLRLSAARVSADVVVIELEGRFPASRGRFARRPQLVVEKDDVRVQHGPIHVDSFGGRWRGTFAVPARDVEDASLSLGLRGTLVELPPPDADEQDRLAAVAREANALRRALEAAERDAATAEADLRARLETAERALAEARSEAAADLERVREESSAELERLREESAAELERVREEAAAEAARAREASAAELEHVREVSSAELERVRAEAEAAAAARVAEAEAVAQTRVEAAERRAAEAEQRFQQADERAHALEVDAGAARDAQAEGRRRAEGVIGELQASLDEARAQAARAEARHAALWRAARDEPATEPLRETGGDDDDDPDEEDDVAGGEPTQLETAVLPRGEDEPEGEDEQGEADEPTQAVPLVGRTRAEQAAAGTPDSWAAGRGEPSPARWMAVAALLLFFVILLVLLGFVSL